MFRIRWLALLVVTVAVTAAGQLEAKTKLDWNPKRTFVFVVGILEWKHPEIWSPFPDCQKDRRDRQLVEHFREAGVPEDQISYLCDAQATKSRIQQAFGRLLDETSEGDLLVFYFCGHGYRDAETGQTWFANYDAGSRDASAWNVAAIFATIEQHFRGNARSFWPTVAIQVRYTIKH